MDEGRGREWTVEIACTINFRAIAYASQGYRAALRDAGSHWIADTSFQQALFPLTLLYRTDIVHSAQCLGPLGRMHIALNNILC